MGQARRHHRDRRRGLGLRPMTGINDAEARGYGALDRAALARLAADMAGES